MHYSTVVYILGTILRIEGALLLLPYTAGLVYSEKESAVYLMAAGISFFIGSILSSKRPARFALYAREGTAAVALSWIAISVMGAWPMWVSGDIPTFSDALYESISGFTTTGSSIVNNVYSLSHATIFWISLTQWVGGMGVIVFMLAVAPVTNSYNMQLMRAESPGPTVGKLVPRVKDSAKILYVIYIVMTLLEFVVLLFSRMPVFNALCTTFALAGTGGFGVYGDSAASFTLVQQAIITISVILFGVNFNVYYYAIRKEFKEILRMEEVRWYLGAIVLATAMITANLWTSGMGIGGSLLTTFHHAIFQVGEAISTNGMSSVDYNLWPLFSQNILLLLMFVGGCAGSTSCGIKMSRVIILFKSMRIEMQRTIHPKSVPVLCVDGRAADRNVTRSVVVYIATYIFIFVGSLVLLTLDGEQSFLTDFTAVLASINNIGPGLDAVGPIECYSGMSLLSKYVLMFDMLAGRLELYPMLLLFSPRIWKRY